MELSGVVDDEQDVDDLVRGVDVVVGLLEHCRAVAESMHDVLGWKVVFDE